MFHTLSWTRGGKTLTIQLRKPEAKDLEALWRMKNDEEAANLLGGFSKGYSTSDIAEWMERHRKFSDEALFALLDGVEGPCIGHVGLYRIDHRVRSCEFAILIGDKSKWGLGVGRNATKWIVSYAFRELNMNRVELTVLGSNERALKLYESLGFQREGLKREAQYKNGKYHDVIEMSILRREWKEP